MEKESLKTRMGKTENDVSSLIGVDREERPDIDHIYMTIAQMMTG